MLREDDPEHLDRLRILGHREPNTVQGRMIEVLEKAALVHLPAHHGPRLLGKGIAGVASNSRGTREAMQEVRKPLGPRVREIAFRFRKIEREIMSHDVMLNSNLSLGDMKMSLG